LLRSDQRLSSIIAHTLMAAGVCGLALGALARA
jgi:hypothetical protein